MARLIALISFVCFTALAREQLTNSSAVMAKEEKQAEALYLPQLSTIKALSFGYSNLLADLLWFKTISYFGKHYRTDQSYTWLRHMCSLVVELDKRTKHVYEFCSSMVAWEVNDPAAGLEFLNRAVRVFPEDWRFLYLRGFHRMFFDRDSQGAHQDFVRASRLPGADPITVRLAAKEMASLSQPEQALEFLEQTINRSESAAEIKALEKRLREVWYEVGFKWNSEAVSAYRSRFGSAPESLNELVAGRKHVLRLHGSLGQTYFLALLDDSAVPGAAQPANYIQAGAVRVMLYDPFNGEYFLNSETNQVESTSQHKRLSQYQVSPLLRERLEQSEAMEE